MKIEETFRVKDEDTEEQTKMDFVEEESKDMRIEDTEEQTVLVKTPGSTVRQCPHCRTKMNCRNRRCVKCGKLLDFKHRQSVRVAKFRARAQQWAKTTIQSRNQSKVLDNVSVMMEKLKALGYVPLLLLGKCSKTQKWTAEVQCPLELPPEGHGLMEKMLIHFEHILQGFKKAHISGTGGVSPTQDLTTAEELNKEKPMMEGIQRETAAGETELFSQGTLLLYYCT
ncbi:uncharacterized protein [Garra rufa]|uniref:uncharacterized protein n=1 Tax=Garra rufa TaxID=137080 RepID=UPI003CCECBFB